MTMKYYQNVFFCMFLLGALVLTFETGVSVEEVD